MRVISVMELRRARGVSAEAEGAGKREEDTFHQMSKPAPASKGATVAGRGSHLYECCAQASAVILSQPQRTCLLLFCGGGVIGCAVIVCVSKEMRSRCHGILYFAGE